MTIREAASTTSTWSASTSKATARSTRIDDAVYRGDKLTKGVWADIIRGSYVAQEFAAPSERVIKLDGSLQARKTDARLYVYDGQILLTAARLYQGQSTDFRSPGGGFAPVFVV